MKRFIVKFVTLISLLLPLSSQANIIYYTLALHVEEQVGSPFGIDSPPSTLHAWFGFDDSYLSSVGFQRNIVSFFEFSLAGVSWTTSDLQNTALTFDSGALETVFFDTMVSGAYDDGSFHVNDLNTEDNTTYWLVNDSSGRPSAYLSGSYEIMAGIQNRPNTPNAVPEPGNILVFLLSFALLLVFRVRR